MHVSIQDVCYHDVMTNPNEVIHGELYAKQPSQAHVRQPNELFDGVLTISKSFLHEALLCDGIFKFIHTNWKHDEVMLSLIHATIKKVEHDGAILLIHARKSGDVMILRKLMLIFVHNDANILWLFLIVSLE